VEFGALVRRVVAERDAIVPAARGVLRASRRGTSYASPPRLRGKVVLRNSGSLRIGRALSVDGLPLPTKIEVYPGAEMVIGTACCINYGVDLVATTRVVLGDGVLIGPLATIVDDDMHQVEPGRARKREPIVLGDNVWLGRGVIVLPGTRIGDHSVVAAGAVVGGEVPARTVVAGVPARPVRDLTVDDPAWRRP
jgi:acetyltransferase-like isoleucine patch superfamily enzyme